MFVYVEYISRRANVALDDFRALTDYTQPRWSELHPEDELILNLGRTWRVGCEPEYLAVWVNRTAGMNRLDEWGQTFEGIEGGSELAVVEHGFLVAARIEHGGVFEAIGDPTKGEGPAYYAEFFDTASGVEAGAIAGYYDRRGAPHPKAARHLLARRVGLLGPDGGVAIWSASSFAALEGLARGATDDDALVRPRRAALYADLGAEVL